MLRKIKDNYTQGERDELYELADNFESLYFFRDDDEEWEAAVLRMVEIIKAKREREQIHSG